MNRTPVALVAVLLGACGGPPPPTLQEQRSVLEAGADPARLGWWRYLDGDADGASKAFERAPRHPLAALGRARLALDRLDARGALAEAGVASAADDPLVRRVAVGWAIAVAKQLPEGKALQAAALGDRGGEALKDARYTVRVSFLPYLDLRRLRQHAPRIDLEAKRAHALGKAWALSKKAPKPDRDGLVLTTWPLPKGEAHLVVEVDGPATAWRDGKLVAATALDRFPSRVIRFSAPGDGPLVLVWAAGEKPKARRVPAAATRRAARAGPVVPERGPGVDWLVRHLWVEAALVDGDAGGAARLLEAAPETAAFAMQRARQHEMDRGRPAGVRRDAASAAWAAAAEVAPARASFALGRIARRRGKLEVARKRLQEALARAPGAYRVHRELARTFLSLGWTEEAEKALAAAAQLAPDRCALLDDRAALAEGRGEGRHGLVDRYIACDRPLDAASRLLELSRPGEAAERLAAVPEAKRKTKWKRLQARAFVGQGRLREAHTLLAAQKSAEDRMRASDLARAANTSLEAGLKALVAAHPTAQQALDVVAAFPQWSPFADLTLDTERAIAEFEAGVPIAGPAVRVLDHSAVLYFKDGKSLRWVHEVLAIRSRDAAEQYGEIGLPAEARVMSLYTRKADGRRLYAEETPEKETVSLTDIEDGDYVVAVYLEPGDNGYLYDTGFLTPRVYFRGMDLPSKRQRFEVFSFDATPPDHQRIHGAPQPTPVELDGRAGLRFDSARVPLLPPEHDTVPPGLFLPSIRAGRAVRLAEDLDYLRDRALWTRRRTVAFDAWARETAGSGGRTQRAVRLARAVREAVNGDAGLVAENVAHARLSGEGNRAATLSAALEAVGIEHRLVVARPKVRVPSGPFLQVADYSYPLIDLGDGWIDPEPDRAPPGFVPFGLTGGDALVVWPPTAAHDPVPIPEERVVPDARSVRLTMRWDEEGRLSGEVEDRLEGQEAIVVGAYLARLDPEKHTRLMERLLVAVVGAAHVTAFEDPSTQDPDGPLLLRYAFTTEPSARLNLGLFPVTPGRNYATLPERATALMVDLPTRLRVSVRLESAADFATTVSRGELAEGPYRYRLHADVEDDAIEIEAALDLPGGAIVPADYERFAAWARKVDAAERVSLERPISARRP